MNYPVAVQRLEREHWANTDKVISSDGQTRCVDVIVVLLIAIVPLELDELTALQRYRA